MDVQTATKANGSVKRSDRLRRKRGPEAAAVYALAVTAWVGGEADTLHELLHYVRHCSDTSFSAVLSIVGAATPHEKASKLSPLAMANESKGKGSLD